MRTNKRRLPCGAEITRDGVEFRVWAPQARQVSVIFEGGKLPSSSLQREPDGYFTGTARVSAGTLYRYRLDDGDALPDPCSRFQPQGPHGPSMVVDPDAYAWRDTEWQGIQLKGQVLYELHVGAFTPEGTFDAAARELPQLAELGVTCIELMPVTEFPGRFNWGYDVADLYAPYHGYGDYDALKRFVDAAHALKLGVIGDVVYNHFGPDGNYLSRFSPHYFTDRYSNEWGDAINFDGSGCQPVREFFVENAAYWIREFHLDGLRLDATQCIYDSSAHHVVAEISERVRAEAAPRKTILIGENEPQRAEYFTPVKDGGFGLDTLWNDDFHHSARVALTGRSDGYFHDHRGTAQELISAVKYGFLFQGQRYEWQNKPRGTPALDAPAPAFVAAIQNHDQVANTFYGQRIHELTSPGRLRAMTAVMLLAPQTPMLFMGQEFNASAPFTFFSDHVPELAGKVWEGRKKFLQQFRHYATQGAQSRIPNPALVSTFEHCKLNFAERQSHRPILDLHRALLRIRRDDPVIARQNAHAIDGAALSERAFLLRWFDDGQGDRLLLVNLGADLELTRAPEPLLAPPQRARWELAWSSDDPEYGGPGAIDPCACEIWRMPAESAMLLRAEKV